MENDLIVDYNKGWRFTQKDLQIGLATHTYERKLLGVTSPLTPDAIYPAFVYSILSAAQNTVTLVNTFNKLKKHGYLTPSNYTEQNMKHINQILSKTHFPNQKINRYNKFNIWWKNDLAKDDSIIKQIIETSNNHSYQKELRRKLATAGCAGVAWKVSSFIIQLSIANPETIKVAVIDKWMLVFLESLGYKINNKKIKPPDYRTISGISSKEYLKCEEYITKIAKEINLSPSQFGLMVWCKVAHTDRLSRISIEPNRKLCEWSTIKEVL
jgi:thermostable 8-oxoguanine DNA glycosylase